MASIGSQINDNDNSSNQIHNISINFDSGHVSRSNQTFISNMETAGAENLQHGIKSIQNTLSLEEMDSLSYEIYRYSSFSTNYVPENILKDCPNDQTSRWSAFNNNPPQFLILKLRRPAIVKKIKFGKFEKSHVCNIKKFRIYCGLHEGNMILRLEGGLRNDHIPETFDLRCEMPILYLKIVPLLSWGSTFNYSIWYVELLGQDDPMCTNTCLRDYNKKREDEILRLCLKHFRQQGYDNAFKALQEQTHARLEHPLITELYKSLVINGDFENSEKIISDFIDEGLMDDYRNSQNYNLVWSLQHRRVQPGKRGGHQLVVDSQRRLIYLYGGWDGYQDLSDLWVFDILNNCWTQIYERSEQYNGPTPRSCHKMVFDPVTKDIFMLGRYLDNSVRTSEYIKSDFFLYDTQSRFWLQICDDTSLFGGPQLVYDHQMCIDVEKRTIYVFGGKILTPRTSTTTEPEYSGLFSYHIPTNSWSQILVDCHHPTASRPDVLSIKSRVTHCMVFHSKYRKLYIYGGQRGKEDMHEFNAYNVDTQTLELLNTTADGCNNCIGGISKSEPSPGYTLRATIDCERNEIYIFSSLSKLKDRRDIQHSDASNSFWVYSLDNHSWSRIYYCRYNFKNSYTSVDGRILENNKRASTEPCPRFAHQLVYDDFSKLHYMFGGNPGRLDFPQLRLDDFWILELEKPKREEIFKQCCYLIRKLHFEEITKSDSLKAVQYLRQHVAEVIDHDNTVQQQNFHKLAVLLFKTNDDIYIKEQCLDTLPIGSEKIVAETSDNTQSAKKFAMNSYESANSDIASSYLAYRKSGGKCSRHYFTHYLRPRRLFLFNKLVHLMPSGMVQPERDLSDFANI